MSNARDIMNSSQKNQKGEEGDEKAKAPYHNRIAATPRHKVFTNLLLFISQPVSRVATTSTSDEFFFFFPLKKVIINGWSKWF